MRTIEELTAQVRSNGGKVTAQRLLIWQALYNNRTHPTAEELYQKLKQVSPTLSLTTLYNTLNELASWGEIRRIDNGDGSIHYDPFVEPHVELVCLACHKVVDSQSKPALLSAPEEMDGFKIISHSEQYYGYCPVCRSAFNQVNK